MPKSESESSQSRKARARLEGLGVRLRAMWDDIVHEPVPEEMMELLRQLDERERDRSTSH